MRRALPCGQPATCPGRRHEAPEHAASRGCPVRMATAERQARIAALMHAHDTAACPGHSRRPPRAEDTAACPGHSRRPPHAENTAACPGHSNRLPRAEDTAVCPGNNR